MKTNEKSLLNTVRLAQDAIAARIPLFYGWIMLPVVRADPSCDLAWTDVRRFHF